MKKEQKTKARNLETRRRRKEENGKRKEPDTR